MSRGLWARSPAWTYGVGIALLAACLFFDAAPGELGDRALLPLRIVGVLLASVLPGWLGCAIVARRVRDDGRLRVLVGWAVPTIVIGTASGLAAIAAMRWDPGSNAIGVPLSAVTALVVYQALHRLDMVAWRGRFAAERHARESAEAARALAQSELKTLQAQIEPHFLFNTLASVQHLVDKDPKLAQYLLAQLTRYLRDTIPSGREAGSTLEREFVLVESLLNIVRVRMGGRLTTHIDLPADLRDASFPPLVLLTLVDNAIRHGVEPKAGAVSIVVSARGVGTGADAHLEVRVLDDGVGLGGKAAGAGVGLENIRARLVALNDARARLNVRPRAKSGVSATVRLPMIRA